MGSALERLIAQAQRRVVANLAAHWSFRALALALLGAIALLLAGTQVLQWYWPVLLFAAAAIYGWTQVRRVIPTSYQVAQRIDQSLNSYDSLSTAWHFRSTDEDVLSDEVRSAQRKQAETFAATVDASGAMPFQVPIAARWCAVLGVAVVALFLARYGVQKSLDLSKPLVAFSLDPFGGGPTQEAANRQKANSPVDQFMQQVSLQPPDTQQNGLDPAPDSALGVVDTPDVNNQNAQPVNGKTGEKGPAGEQGEKMDGSEPSEGASGDDKNANDNAPPASNNEGKAQQRNAKNQQSQQQGENSSMLDKMRDAMANLMNKLNTPKQQQEGGQQQSQSKQGQQQANARQSQSKQGMQAKGQQGEQQSQNQQAGSEDQDMDPSQSQSGKAGEKNAQQAADQQNKSGMGKQDGDKDVKLAEQMAAMGKISEIIGKRNENLKGEIMIEVSSSKQQLKTQYAQRNAKHTDSGGEIHRDEVPLIYQDYVQHYFEEVRKGTGSFTPAPAVPPAAKTGKSAPAAAGASR